MSLARPLQVLQHPEPVLRCIVRAVDAHAVHPLAQEPADQRVVFTASIGIVTMMATPRPAGRGPSTASVRASSRRCPVARSTQWAMPRANSRGVRRAGQGHGARPLQRRERATPHDPARTALPSQAASAEDAGRDSGARDSGAGSSHWPGAADALPAAGQAILHEADHLPANLFDVRNQSAEFVLLAGSGHRVPQATTSKRHTTDCVAAGRAARQFSIATSRSTRATLRRISGRPGPLHLRYTPVACRTLPRARPSVATLKHGRHWRTGVRTMRRARPIRLPTQGVPLEHGPKIRHLCITGTDRRDSETALDGRDDGRRVMRHVINSGRPAQTWRHDQRRNARARSPLIVGTVRIGLSRGRHVVPVPPNSS